MEENIKDMTCSEVLANYSPLALAFLGDAAYELEIRNYVVRQGNALPKNLNNRSSFFAKAHTQAVLAEALMQELTEEEISVFKRGRNASPNSMPKHASPSDYHMATGLETLIGFLYLSGQTDRMKSLISIACHTLDPEV